MAEPDNTGPDEAGADKAGADSAGTDKAGTDKAGTGSAGGGRAGAGKAPETRSRAGSRASAPEGTAGAGQQSAAAGGRAGRATLKLHHLRPAPGARRDRNRKGRGEASKGKTAGRGTKGTRARDTVPPGFEGGQMPLHRRVPKLKGFSNSAFKTTYQVVNLDRLTALYPSGGDVTPDDLAARGAVRKGVPVKILGTGEAGAKLRVTAHAFSGSAREKITAAGGSVTEL